MTKLKNSLLLIPILSTFLIFSCHDLVFSKELPKRLGFTLGGSIQEVKISYLEKGISPVHEGPHEDALNVLLYKNTIAPLDGVENVIYVNVDDKLMRFFINYNTENISSKLLMKKLNQLHNAFSMKLGEPTYNIENNPNNYSYNNIVEGILAGQVSFFKAWQNGNVMTGISIFPNNPEKYTFYVVYEYLPIEKFTSTVMLSRSEFNVNLGDPIKKYLNIIGWTELQQGKFDITRYNLEDEDRLNLMLNDKQNLLLEFINGELFRISKLYFSEQELIEFFYFKDRYYLNYGAPSLDKYEALTWEDDETVLKVNNKENQRFILIGDRKLSTSKTKF